GLRKGGFLDNLVLVSTLFVISVPIFVTGFTLQYVLGLQWELVPALVGAEPTFYSLLLPGFVLGSLSMAYIARLMRSNIGDNYKSDYVRTAKAKGLAPRRVLMKHIVGNALVPMITLAGLQLPTLLGGALVTETVFTWPGMGRLFLDSLGYNDYPVVMGLLMFSAILVLVGNLAADLLVALVDPRIRLD
ncbi:MAG: ABC transporter permease, partial [Cereibacter changlensis]